MQLEHNIFQPVGTRQPIPVLLLHGAWHGAWCYDLWAADFAAHGYETHTMSLPGHGESQRTKRLNRYSFDDYAHALAQIVEEINPKPFVIAHSMGGMVLQHYLKTHPLPGGVLLSSIPINGILGFELRKLIKHPVLFMCAMLTANLYVLVSTPERATENFLTANSAHNGTWLADRLGGESLWIAIQSSFIVRGDPKRVTTPLLVVAAERDAIFMVQEEQNTANAYHADFILIPDQGHNLMMERDWQHTADQIRGWLAQHSEPGQ